MKDFEPPMRWADYEDIAAKLFDSFGDDFTDADIENATHSDLREWVLELPNFAGTADEAETRHLEMIRNTWIHEWRNNEKPNDSNLK